jgi:predicted nucleic acid-binding protein
MLIDTDVLIDHNRMHPAAVSFILNLSARPSISAITIAELYADIREGRERTELDSFISQCNVVAVEMQIAERGGLLLRQYNKSHGVGFPDAMIAATAEVERATLVTLNLKHFPMLTDVLVPYTKS